MNKIYTISELPRHYFGLEYTIFSFDVLSGVIPLALTNDRQRDCRISNFDKYSSG